MRRFTLFISLLLFCKCLFATLNVPRNLITFSSIQGQHLLSHSQKTAFFELMPYFVTQQNLTYCAPATATMVLNALNVPRPITKRYTPYRLFTQDNVFNKKVRAIVPPSLVKKEGMTLNEMNRLLDSYALHTKRIFANSNHFDRFHKKAIHAVSHAHELIVVNFCRRYIHEKGCGHFSPLAAYNKKTDRFLLLDVSRYKYPPVWVKAKALYLAMSQGLDTTSKKHRGYIIIQN